MAREHGKGMLVLIGGLLVVSFLYFVSVMKKDEEAKNDKKSEKSNQTNNSQTSSTSPDVTNMECSQSSPKYICSICGSRTMTIKIEEKIEESTTTTIIEEENSNFLPFNNNSNNNNNNPRRVPFPEAGVDIVDRKLKNTEESLEKEIEEYCSHDDDVLTYTESWTDNWLFRKKDNEDNKTSFKPVSMFVPNTTAKYRAMIGDQNVDEISDLSDDHCSSNDTEGEEEDDDDDTMATRRRKVGSGMAKYIYDQRSRVFIDGKSKRHIEELSLREANLLPSRDSFDTSYCETDAKQKNTVSQECDLTDLNDDVTNENGVENQRSYYRSELFIETRDVNQNSSSSSQVTAPLLLLLACDDKLSDIDFNLFSPPKPGTYADREHRKWETAAPIANNPYSEENLQRRLLEKKYTPKYSSTSSLLGIASRTNGLDDRKSSSDDSTAGMTMKNGIDFETMDMLPEKSSVNNNTPIIESEDKSIAGSNFETMDFAEKSNTPMIEESRKDEIINCKSADIKSRIKQLKSNHIPEEYGTKNKKKCSNSKTIKVTKKDATTTINEVDDNSDEEQITLPCVKKLVEVFHRKSRQISEGLNKPKDQSTTRSSDVEQRPKFKRIERTLQQSSSPRPLHLHSLTARSLSKEFREGLR